MRLHFSLIVLLALVGCGVQVVDHTKVYGTLSFGDQSSPVEAAIIKFYRTNGHKESFLTWISPTSEGEFQALVPKGDGSVLVRVQKGLEEGELMIAGIGETHQAEVHLEMKSNQELVATQVNLHRYTPLARALDRVLGVKRIDPMLMADRINYEDCYTASRDTSIEEFRNQLPGEQHDKMADFAADLHCHLSTKVDWKPGLSEVRNCQAKIYLEHRSEGKAHAVLKALASSKGNNPRCPTIVSPTTALAPSDSTSKPNNNKLDNPKPVRFKQCYDYVLGDVGLTYKRLDPKRSETLSHIDAKFHCYGHPNVIKKPSLTSQQRCQLKVLHDSFPSLGRFRAVQKAWDSRSDTCRQRPNL